MEPSWRVIAASSASDNSSRARCATSATSFAVNDMGDAPSDRGRHRERFPLLRPLDLAAADALDADAHALDGAADLALQALQIGAEGALAAAADLAADAAEVLGLAAAD